MMKKLLPIALLALLMAACGKSDVEKANALLQSQYPEIAQLGTITQLDSLFEFEEAIQLNTKAANIEHEADSIIVYEIDYWKNNKNATYKERSNAAQRLQDDAMGMYRTAYKYRRDALGVKTEKAITHENATFNGFKTAIENDSLKYEIVYDKDVSKIFYIQGNMRPVFEQRIKH